MNYPHLHQLIQIVETLLDPKEGCPWDLKQTHESLLKYLVEESYEFIHAVETKDTAHMEEELGDILLQVLLHSTMAGQKQTFNLESVAARLSQKLIHRHPHIFKEKNSNLSADEVLANWEELKQQEKTAKVAQGVGPKETYQINSSFLNFPALMSAHKIGHKTAKLGFDWENYSQVLYKVEEEWQELKEELPPSGEFNKERIIEEMGDLLFSVAQLGRHLGLEPEETLRLANKKFVERFNHLEDLLKEKKADLLSLNEEEKEAYWMKAKLLQKKR